MKAKDFLKKWNNYFNDGNLSDIVDLYDQSSILIPTFSNDFFLSREKIRNYFFKIFTEQKGSVEILFESLYDNQICENTFLLNGNYNFKLKDEVEIPARFSFLIVITNQSPIKLHHSSRMI